MKLREIVDTLCGNSPHVQQLRSLRGRNEQVGRDANEETQTLRRDSIFSKPPVVVYTESEQQILDAADRGEGFDFPPGFRGEGLSAEEVRKMADYLRAGRRLPEERSR